jgi:uncharacterized membrane protein YvbJ
VVKNLVYCSHCGTKIDDEAYFCPKCGTKTQTGKQANASYPADELRDAFYQIGNEMEKAFTLAAREMHSAFKKVSEDVKQKPPTETSGMVTCPNCGTKNPPDSVFCHNCGKKIAPENASGST